MVGTGGIIPTRSKRQALDWSLVLLSQGIESEVDRGEDGRWQIAVRSAEFGRAVQMLRLYTIENRRGPQMPLPKLRFDWGQTWFFALLILIFALSATAMPVLRQIGIMNSRAFFSGEWWRPLTGVLLHHDAPHLVANVVIGMLFLGLAGGMFGTWTAFLLSYASGAVANVIGATVYGDKAGILGASGMVMGALGLLTSFSLAHVSQLNGKSLAYRGVAGGLLLLVLLGFDPNPQTDVLAHVTGFVLGIIFGILAVWMHRRNGRKDIALIEAQTASGSQGHG